MRHGQFLVAILLAAAATSAAGQTAPYQERTTPPQPLAEADDPVNRYVERMTVDGLVLQLGIDGASVTLEGAQPAGILRTRGRRSLRGDTVTVTALSGDERVGSVTISDPITIIQEGVGLFRADRRTLVVAVPAPGAVDAIEVRVSATGAIQRFDVRPAYARICRALPEAPPCSRSGANYRR